MIPNRYLGGCLGSDRDDRLVTKVADDGEGARDNEEEACDRSGPAAMDVGAFGTEAVTVPYHELCEGAEKDSDDGLGNINGAVVACIHIQSQKGRSYPAHNAPQRDEEVNNERDGKEEG